MKNMQIATLTVSLLLLLSACAASPGVEPPGDGGAASPTPAAPVPLEYEIPEPVSTWTVTDGITFSLVQDAYPVGTEQFTMVLENQTDLELLYGEELSFQKYVDGQWQTLEVQPDFYWFAAAYMLAPHTAKTFSISTQSLAQSLDEGLYRVTGSEMSLSTDERVPAWQVELRIAADAPPEPDYALLVTSQPVSGLDSIPFLILNTTGQDAAILEIPHLERQTGDGVWEEVPYREQVGFCGTPDTLFSGVRCWSEDPLILWGALETGRYRLSYQVGPTTSTEDVISGEFTVKSPEICALPTADGE